MGPRKSVKGKQLIVDIVEKSPTPDPENKVVPPKKPAGRAAAGKSTNKTSTKNKIVAGGGATDTIEVDAESATSPSADGPPAKRRKQTHNTSKPVDEDDVDELTIELDNNTTAKLPSKSKFRLPVAPRSASTAGNTTIPATPSTSTTTIQVTTAPAPKPKRPPFCCPDMEKSDPKRLLFCDNKTCVERHASILLGNELKYTDYSLPYASDAMVQTKDFLIQVLKYTPKINLVLAGTRLKVIDKSGEKKWEVDTEVFSTGMGRFYVAPDHDKLKGKNEDDGSIWYEIHDMGVGDAGLKRLGEYVRSDASLVKFGCEHHHEEYWVCVLWNKRKD